MATKKITIEITKAQAKRFVYAHRKVSELLGNENTEDDEIINAAQDIFPNLHDYTLPMLHQIKKQL